MITSDPSPRFRLHNGHLGAIALLAGLFVYFSFNPLWHTDVWAHAKYGEWYWTHRTVPPVEPLSPFTDKTVPFANVAWLSQVTYYGLYEFGAAIAGGDAESRLLGGAEALRSFHLLLLTGRLLFLWLALQRFGGSAAWATLSVALYALALRQEVIIQRPQAFGVFFLTVVLYALSSPALSRRAMILLPVLFLLWANLHGTFIVGLAVLGLHALGRVIERGPRDREVQRLVMVGIMCGVATLINPHGPILYWHVLTFSGHPNLKSMTEWWPMERTNSGAWAMSLMFLAFVRVVGGRRVGPSGCLVALPFALWPWLQFRAITWWWTLAVWLLARLGPGLGDRFATLPSIPDGERTRAKALLAVAIIIAVALFFPPIRGMCPGVPNDLEHTVSIGTPWRLGLEMNAQPADEGRWLPALRLVLREQYPDGRYRGSIFSSETQGDFLIWALPTDKPVLMFTHAHVFSFEHWEACRNVKAGNPGWEEFLKGHDCNLVIVETHSHEELTERLRQSSDWQTVQDGSVMIAIRRISIW